MRGAAREPVVPALERASSAKGGMTLAAMVRVHSCLRRCLRSGVNLRIPTGCVALRSDRGDMGRRSRLEMANQARIEVRQSMGAVRHRCALHALPRTRGLEPQGELAGASVLG